ncbi:fatty acid desaturase [Phreatobacter stygius]|uniref:Fatty acid desaturase n=1 Tax=Phreatobacter stygius TaxID=1940610 RepID=A0A4D7ASG0_9HYPH|nr:fatty acid desaturase [Phreatobacter stygius]QCI63899.1 fatty acid desaturase [Phreatobacter stygius]
MHGTTLTTGKPKQSGFYHSISAEPHASRTKAILKAHPEIRALIGRNPWTAAVMVSHVAAQILVAIGFGHLGLDWWWAALGVGWLFGAFMNHNLFIVIHEATHNLVLRSRNANKLIAIIADLPNCLPTAMNFRAFHLQHHAFQGDMERDADLPSAWEARLVGHSVFGKVLWLFLFPLFQGAHALRVSRLAPRDGWALANMAATVVFVVTMGWFAGANALVYLIASFWFAIGLHPLGGRWIQEHYTLDPEQETGSYYGGLNRVSMNIGYHNEHHDFPSVPWNRLPEITRIAPEFYLTLVSHQSWTRLLWEFFTDPRYSLHSRVTRDPSPGRGGSPQA